MTKQPSTADLEAIRLDRIHRMLADLEWLRGMVAPHFQETTEEAVRDLKRAIRAHAYLIQDGHGK